MRHSARLFGAGLISEVVYLAVTVRLPWWRYGGSLTSWSHLLGGQRWTLAACLAGIGVVMAAYVWGWHVVRQGKRERWIVWGFATLFAMTLVWLMPITSDLFIYLSRAHLITDRHVNPLLAAPLELPADPLLQAYPAFYASRPSVYGPAWMLVTVPATSGRYDVAWGMLYLKGLATIAYLGCAWLLEQILRQIRPASAVEGLYLFAWSPLVLLMGVGDGHNDMTMIVLVLLALWLVLRGRWALAFGALMLSVWIKYVSVILFPLFVIYAWKHGEVSREHGQSRWLVLTGGALATVVVSVFVVSPFWTPGVLSEVVGRLLHPANWPGRAMSLGASVFGVGLLLFSMAYAGLAWRFAVGARSFQRLTNAAFAVSLLAFVLGAARSQPWHLVWPLALAALSDRRWVWPVSIGLSVVMLVVQVWVEWGAPGWRVL